MKGLIKCKLSTKIILIMLLNVFLFITACSNNDYDSQTSQKQKSSDTLTTQIEHIHGLAYALDGKTLYMATHKGLFKTEDLGESWHMVGNEDIDFMGFNILSDGTMITSGHPGPRTKLPNPLGFLISKDYGESWEPISLTGKVDFHSLAPNIKDPNVIYGLNQMGNGEYGAGIYKTKDGGEKWDKIDSQGLPNDLHQIYAFLSISDNPDILLAGTEEGVMKSEDGGESWFVFDDTRIITALQSIPDTDNYIISYSISTSERGVMISKDGGNTLENIGLDLEQDAVAYFAINPINNQEIVASSFNSFVYFTNDGGENWEVLFEK